MSNKEETIRKITIDVPCVVDGENRKRGDDVSVEPEDGKYLVGSGRAVIAGSDDAKRIKDEVKQGFVKPGKQVKKAA